MLDRHKTRWGLVTAGVGGFLVGTSGYAVAVSLVLVSGLEVLGSLQGLQKDKLNKFYEKLIFLASLLFGIYFSVNSPGAINRKGQLITDSNLGAIFSVSINAITSWIDLLISGGALYVVLVGFLTFYLLINLGRTLNLEKIKLFAIRLMLLSFLIFIISKVSELFSYAVFWHTIFSSTLLYLGLFAIGTALAGQMQAKIKQNYLPLTLVTLGSLLLVSMYALSQSETRIENRRAQWDSGPAPSVNGQPADREIPWIDDCWVQLQNMKSD